VLVGQPELRERLRHRTYRALTQRLGAEFHLTPLSLEDVREYVRHRLKVAGTTRDLFDEGALQLLHEVSGGIPRVLNHLASQALIEGMARGVPRVDARVAAAAMADRDLAAGPPATPSAGGGRPAARIAAEPGERPSRVANR
jgi:type II secretory pathway predicted ATPase ExeA